MFKQHMQLSRLRLLVLSLVVILVATGCYGTRQGESWAALSVAEVYGKPAIVVAYKDKITLLQPRNGAPVRLENNEGDPRFDENDEPRIWEIVGANYENAQFFASPTLIDAGKMMILPSLTSRLLEVDVFTAEPESTTGIPVDESVIASVIVDGDMFYVPIKTGAIQAFDYAKKDTKWLYEVGEGIWSKPVLNNDVLYFGSLDHFLYALDAETGDAIWDKPVDLEGAITASPLVTDDVIYAGSFAHKLYKISLDGGIEATYEGHNWVWSPPVLFDDTLYYTDLSGYVYALNPDDLQEVWSVKAAGRGIRPAPLVTDDYVIVGSRDGIVHWLDRKSGEILHERQIEGGGEILSDILLLEADPDASIPEPMIVISTSSLSHLVVALPLDYTSGYQGWSYSR